MPGILILLAGSETIKGALVLVGGWVVGAGGHQLITQRMQKNRDAKRRMELIGALAVMSSKESQETPAQETCIAA